MAHTPGPWTVRETMVHNRGRFENWIIVEQEEEGEDGREWVVEIETTPAIADRDRANAELIAAAPDMLALLKTIRDDMSGRTFRPPWMSDLKTFFGKD